MNNRILILGAGNAQIDLIERCRELGMEVHGVSYSDKDPGIPMLHRFEQINIVDVDGVTDYIRRHDIGYIYSVGSDIAVPTICEAARQTALRCFVSPRTARICCNKQLMRRALSGSKYQVAYAAIRRPEEAQKIDFYPVMMKPVDAQGQRGIFLCRTPQDVREHFGEAMAFSHCGELILERYVPGDEVSLNGYVIDGRLAFGLISDRESFDEYPGGIVRGHRIPSRFAGTETEERVFELAKEAVDRLEILNGPVYFQIMIDKGWPYLLEVTPRLDGCHMWKLIELYTGVDLLGIALGHLLTGCAEIPRWTPLVCAARTEFICRKPGTAFSPEKTDASAAFSREYYRPGEQVRRINGYREKCGYRMYIRRLRVGLIGGSGMIGSRFQRLYERQFSLTDISRSTGGVAAYRRDDLTKALNRCDAAVILAAKKAAGQPDDDFDVNPQIAREAMEACHTAGVNRVVYLSTRCVYDPETTTPFSEETPVSPINPYGESKALAEQVCLELGKRYGIRVIVLRVAQVLSSREPGTAFGTFLRRAISGEELIVYGRGKGQRDYVFVDDVCEGIRLALLAKDASGVYNIGSGVPTSIAALAAAAVEAAGSEANIIFRQDMLEDETVSVLDISRAKAELGYVPAFSVAEAARACAAQMKEGM